MPGPITVNDGELVTKDPADRPVLKFDWDALHLADGVTITESTWTITAIKPVTDTALTKDSESILSGNRRTQLRLIGGTLGAEYLLSNRIVTNETPAQTFERSVPILVETK